MINSEGILLEVEEHEDRQVPIGFYDFTLVGDLHKTDPTEGLIFEKEKMFVLLFPTRRFHCVYEGSESVLPHFYTSVEFLNIVYIISLGGGGLSFSVNSQRIGGGFLFSPSTRKSSALLDSRPL